MDTELNHLDEKLSQLLRFCQRLREENHTLRQQLATEQNQNKVLTDKLDGAKDRLTTLLNHIPEA